MCIRDRAVGGGRAIAGNDDLYAMGPASIVFPAVETFSKACRDKYGLTPQYAKTKVYHKSGIFPPQAPMEMKNAGETVGDMWQPGFMCYGVAVGTPEFVQHKLLEHVQQLEVEIDKVMDLLCDDHQAAWSVISASLSHQLDYSISLQYPSDVKEAARRLDNKIWSALEQIAGQSIPKTDEDRGYECVVDLPTVPELQGRSFQHWQAQQPVKLGGLGLRSIEGTIPAAFIGGVEMSIPHMVTSDGDRGICPELEDVCGVVEGEERWKDFLEGGSQTAREFSASWELLSTEAKNIWEALGKEPFGALSIEVDCAGGSSVDGSTRKLVQQQIEGLRFELLGWALKNHHDRNARPTRVFKDIADDKVAGRWLLATPGSGLSMAGPVFQEALAAHLCLPSPAIMKGGWEGKHLGRNGARIDKFGSAVMNNCEIPGDSWRRKHDNVKLHVMNEALLSGIHVDCEVFGLFSNLLPAHLMQEGGELQWGRARQGAIPDFKLMSNTPEGPVSSLAELKVLNCGETRYPHGQAGKATDRRAALIGGEYERKLRKYDVKYHGAAPRVRNQPEPPPGPLVQSCLLYTSPSPRDLSTGRMPSCA